jgi:O6-methylguanine-DNA--protein-cysteine methyltransferase
MPKDLMKFVFKQSERKQQATGAAKGVDAQVTGWFETGEKKKKAEKRKHADITAHQHRVYELVKTVPAGSVTTYGAVAKALNPPSHARAVGQAMKRNPYGYDMMP